jgi:iron complex outermembrane receptor protein
MSLRTFLLSIILSLPGAIQAQEDTVMNPDSTHLLHEIIVQGYGYNRPLSEVPASIVMLDQRDLQRFGNTSLLPAINTIPGVRMEERSPGSYRFSMRGSSLRSPFGVRNVKIYWNDLPFTDPGGNTYLNLFDFNSVDALEAIKGPGSSLYGAGTGGVLLLKNTSALKTGVEASSLVGSFGLLQYSLKATTRSSRSGIQLRYAHQESDGYRQQTAMLRDVVQAQGDFYAEKSTFSVNMLYSDLLYQTPGGLTLQQFKNDPKQARPAGGPNPGAVEQHATVYNKTFFTGFNHQYEWNDRWSNKTGVYGTFTQFKNPAIRNYERRTEQSFGGRTNTQYRFSHGKLNFGAEFQHGFSPVSVYDNNQGISGDQQSADEISITTYFGFAQAEFFLPADMFLTVGASLNKLNVNFTRLSDTPPLLEERKFKAVFSPRVALLKKITPDLSAYASFSQGYSPPTVQELYPSAGYFDRNLDPERGNNFELGLRGNFVNKTFTLDITAYDFQLDKTIVIRRTEDDAEYFINAGNTSQRGVEAQLAWSPTIRPASWLSAFRVWTSYTRVDYTFKDYLKVIAADDTTNLSGKSLTGVPPTIMTGGIDLAIKAGLYLNITYSYTDEIPLQDENTEYAGSYSLLNGRLGYKRSWTRFALDLFTGIDNALDERYSLGNDLNAPGGRYYNAAPAVNYYAGIKGAWTFNP